VLPIVERLQFRDKVKMRAVARRFDWVVLRDPLFFNNTKYAGPLPAKRVARQKEEKDEQTSLTEAREGRGKRNMSVLLIMNVLLGLVQLGISAPELDSTCEEPLPEILLICGIMNVVQICSFLLCFCPDKVFNQSSSGHLGVPDLHMYRCSDLWTNMAMKSLVGQCIWWA
jgi:hypothetical protein